MKRDQSDHVHAWNAATEPTSGAWAVVIVLDLDQVDAGPAVQPMGDCGGFDGAGIGGVGRANPAGSGSGSTAVAFQGGGGVRSAVVTHKCLKIVVVRVEG
ncbi:MAG: hypothetical protein ACOYD1_13155 [Candidatus Nanopelagicales bacterium]